jgi:hypothetical protein
MQVMCAAQSHASSTPQCPESTHIVPCNKFNVNSNVQIFLDTSVMYQVDFSNVLVDPKPVLTSRATASCQIILEWCLLGCYAVWLL